MALTNDIMTTKQGSNKMSDRVNEWFAVMVKGLAAQGWQRSITQIDGVPLPQCVYRGEDGRKCPVGMILPEDSPIMISNEVVGVAKLSENERLGHLGLGPLVGREYFFLVEAQRAHDGAIFDGKPLGITPEEMKENFRRLANVYWIEPLPIELKEETKP